MNSNPTVSVLMSVYNENSVYLREAVESVLMQSYENFEFLIINDGSSDRECDQVLRKYLEKDQRIRYIVNEKNIGLTKSLNMGLRIARGRFLARMDSDDISDEKRLEMQIRYLTLHPDVSVVGSRIINIDDFSEILVFPKPPSDDIRAVWMLFGNAGVPHPSSMMNLSFLRKNHIAYNEKFRYAQDYELWTQIILHGGRIHVLPQALLKYRVHTGQITALHRETQLKLTDEIRHAYYQKVNRSELSNEEWDCFQRLIEGLRPENPEEDVRMIRKILGGNTFLEQAVLEKEIYFLWLKRAIKLIKTDKKMFFRCFQNRYNLQLFLPSFFFYLIKYHLKDHII